MFRSLFVLCGVVLLLASGVGFGAVVASENGTVDDSTEVVEFECEENERLDALTVYCAGEVRDEVAVLEVYSEMNQTVTVVDGSWLMLGGEPQDRDFDLESGHNTIRMPVDTVDGNAGVDLQTSRTPHYGIPLESRSALIGGPWSHTDVHAGIAGAVVGVSIVTTWVCWRRYRGRTTEPRRIA